MKNPLNSIYDLDWKPRIIIEASAGTGKTYTIVGLFVRLLIEKGLDIDQILVMTFTKKATSELRERIFERLRECLAILEEDGESADAFLQEFKSRVDNQEKAILRLRHAIQNFDDAQVFTIHGFCQKVLSEHALLTGSPFEFNVTKHDDMLLEAAEDFWRDFMYKHQNMEAGRYYISKLLDIAKTPVEFIDNLSDLFEKPYAEVEGKVMDEPVRYLEDVIDKRREMAELWNNEKDEILRILYKCDVSRFQQYLDSRLSKLRDFLNDGSLSIDTPDSLGYFRADYLYDESNLPTSRETEPTEHHDFFRLCEEFDELISDIKQVETTLIYQAFKSIRVRREELVKNSGSVTYNDLLISLEKALHEEDKGELLANTLLEKYPFALIDEFQDTDPIQYSVFNTIYPREGDYTGLMMIGDPKQAIYGFRGADIYTYFQAKEEGADKLYTLNRNFRSRPSLIRAVNTLFEGDHQPFIEDEIGFFKSKPGNKGIEDDYQIEGKTPAALKIVARRGIESNKENSKEIVADLTVKEVADLLEKAEKGKAVIGNRKLRAGDIAILVSSHKQAFILKQKLKEFGVYAVTYSNQKVFETFEAKRLNLLLEAVLQPQDRTAQNNLLLSGFFGIELNELHALKESEEQRQTLTEELQELRETWQTYGFYAMFRAALFNGDRLAELSELNNAERIITNLYQLADICSEVEQDDGLDPHALYSWYLKELTDPDADDEKTLLLESDQNLVKISTIHNSKGLEFPVVFCPSFWDGRSPKKQLLELYHSRNGGELTINFEQSNSEKRTSAKHKRMVENIAEEVRKLYVAVTRAKYHCTIFWDTHETSNNSGLGSSIIGRKQVINSVENNSKVKDGGGFTDQTFINRFKKLSENSDGSIDFVEFDVPIKRSKKVEWSKKDISDAKLKIYKGRPELPVQQKLESFSSMVHGKSDPGEPDYDQELKHYLRTITLEESPEQAPTIFNFPRGANPGTAIHKLFEHDDFDFTKVKTDPYKWMVEEVLEEYRIDLKWTGSVLWMLENVTQSAIPNLSLEEVERRDQLREMEFNFPSKQTDSRRLFEIIRNGKKLKALTQNAKGMMTGFVDLIVRQNGRYFILDYKSNYLGDETEDYTPEKLNAEMKSAGYDLQAHLYTVALLKYLRRRVPSFDYKTQFGGAVYLFVRGVKAGSQNGVWFHKPDYDIIRKLEEELDRA